MGAHTAKHCKQGNSKGFTLIELMIVVAIIGILAAIAIPAYQTYTIRSQVAEGITLASSAKTQVVEAYHDDGEAPADRAEAGMTATATDTAGSYVESIDVQDDSLVITFDLAANTAIAGQTLYLTPYENGGGNVVWRCGNQAAPSAGGAALPLMGTDAGGNTASYIASTISSRYLPASCR